MHGLVLIFLVSILASTVYAEPYNLIDAPDSFGVRGCTGKILVTPPFKRGYIE